MRSAYSSLASPPAATKFEAHFERMWDAAQPMIEFEPTINALEPVTAKAGESGLGSGSGLRQRRVTRVG
jgi:hypothetical protein